MARNRFLTESMIQDIGMQMVDNTYQALLDLGYEEHEIDNIVTRDSIEFDIINGSCVLYCGNETIFETPSSTLLHKCIEEAEDALLNWCIKKIGREPDYIDADDLFQDVPGWNNTNENKNYNNMKGKKTIRFTESELKAMISESVKQIIKENTGNIESEFSDWALNTCHRTNRGFNAMGKLYEYYYDDNDDALLTVAEEFTDTYGGDLEEVYEIARKFANYYFHYNPVEMEEEMEEENNDIYESVKTCVTESLKKYLKEGGHIFHQDEDGAIHTNSKETWRGVPGTTFIYHGEWSDPEIAYKGELLNYWDVEEGLQYSYQADVESGDFEGSFDEWAEAQDPKYLASQLDEYIWAMQG